MVAKTDFWVVKMLLKRVKQEKSLGWLVKTRLRQQ